MCSLDDKLSNFERASALRAHEHSEAAEKARDRKQTARRDIGGSRSQREADGRAHDAEIDHHEKQARVHSRRREYAENGFLLHSPSESGDADYMRDHGELFAEAQRAGRVKFSDES
jgi:hypothetical protein